MKKLTHKFVEFVPRPLEDDVLYISIRFRIATHKCCCGCGNEVAVNLSPNGWQVIFDGETVSLHPSIGNWNFKCKSHYWITNDTVEWAESWSDMRIRLARETDQRAYTTPAKDETQPTLGAKPKSTSTRDNDVLSAIRRRLFRGKK